MCIKKPAKSFWMRALALIKGRRRGGFAMQAAGKPAEPEPQRPIPETHSGAGCCASCAFRTRGDASPLPLCRPRNFSIVHPAYTWCRSFGLRHPLSQGAIHHIWPDRSRSPWVGLIAPHAADGICAVCGRRAKDGIGIDLLEGSVRACGVEHYFTWWVGYQEQRLDFFKHVGEKVLRDFCNLASYSSASASYSDAREAFEDALAVARDLERPEEVRMIEKRLDYIQRIFETQPE